jgi:hypothetical protein
VKKVAQTKVQCVILTVFTFFIVFLHLFRPESGDARGQNPRRNFFVGWSDPTHHFGHGTVCKSGVAPAQQHGVLPASKLTVLSCTSSSLSGASHPPTLEKAIEAL